MPCLEYSVLFGAVTLALLFIGIKFVQMRRLAISGKYSLRKAGVTYFFAAFLSPLFVMVVVWLISKLVESIEGPFHHSVFLGEPVFSNRKMRLKVSGLRGEFGSTVNGKE